MDVVRTSELHTSPQRIDEAAALDEGRRHGETEEREPGDRHEIDPRKIAEEPRQADRQECDEAGRQRDDHVATAADRPDQRDRAAVRGGEDQGPEGEVEDRPRRPLQLCVRHTEQRRPDAESQ